MQAKHKNAVSAPELVPSSSDAASPTRPITAEPEPAGARRMPVGFNLDALATMPSDDSINSPSVAADLDGSVRAERRHGLVLTDETLNVRAAWGPLFALTRPTAAELVDATISSLVHPADMHRLTRSMQSVFMSSDHVEWTSLRVGGHDGRWIETGAILSQSDGRDRRQFLISLHEGTENTARSPADRPAFEHIVHQTMRRLSAESSTTAAGSALDRSIDEALAAMAAEFGADSVRFGILEPNLGAFCRYAEWPAPEIGIMDDPFVVVPVRLSPQVFKRLARFETVHCATLDELGPEFENDVKFLTTWNLGGFCAIPFHLDGGLVGALWLDRGEADGDWRLDRHDSARVVGSLIGQIAIGRSESESSTGSIAIMRAAFEDAPVSMAVLALDGRFLDANVEFRRLFGRSADGIRSGTIFDCVGPEETRVIERLLERCRTDRETVAFKNEMQLMTKGQRQWCRVGTRVVRGRDGSPVSVMLTIEDLHQLKSSEETKRRAAQRYEDLLGLLPDPMFLFDPSGEVRFANGAAIDHFGSFFDAGLRRWAIQDLAVDWLGAVADTKPGSRHRSIEREIVQGGRRRFFEIRLVSEFSQNLGVESVLVVLRDLTERRNAIEQLAHQASHDSLTQLPNRDSFLLSLETALARLAVRHTELAVLFFDLDRFKVVNDSLGHAVGDVLLKEAADRLQLALRPSDTLARLGGDEFTILVEGVTSPQVVERVVERLQGALAQPIEFGNHEFTLSASVGIAITGDPDEEPAELLRWADAAMYRAKAMGPGHYSFFDEELSAVVKDQLDLDQRLVSALERREVRVHFQPEVELASGRIVGCEALLRWAHPERGMLSLGQFARVAEESGAIVGLGAWVIAQACEQAARWRLIAGDDFVLRVNMSVRELERPDVLDRVRENLESAGLPPSSLCIEITETAMMDNPLRNMEVLNGLHDMGVELAIDDFGTGYSSLSYLKRLPVHILKIDRSFVDGLPDDEDDQALVEVILKLAETMELATTAEGIETMGQRDALLRLGCTRGQGFLFDKALDADTFTARLNAGARYDIASLPDWIEPTESGSPVVDG